MTKINKLPRKFMALEVRDMVFGDEGYVTNADLAVMTDGEVYVHKNAVLGRSHPNNQSRFRLQLSEVDGLTLFIPNDTSTRFKTEDMTPNSSFFTPIDSVVISYGERRL
jgi:hypothetical protein